MSAITSGKSIKKGKSEAIEWNTLFLLLLLTLPAGIMAFILLMWPDTKWVAEIPFTAIGILGAFTGMLLSVFIIARYRADQGVIYIGAGLMSMAIINGIQSVLTPESSVFVWLNSAAGISGSFFFSIYVLNRMNRLPFRVVEVIERRSKWILVIVGIVSAIIAVLFLGFGDRLPVLIDGEYYSNIAWVINSIPIALFLFSGVSLFFMYRKTESHELFLFTAIVIFLFQASEVIYLSAFWSVIWWFWLSLRFAVYMAVLYFVLREYIQISNSLGAEIEERNQIEVALRKAEENWRNSFNSLEEAMMIIDQDYRIENINSSGLSLLGETKDAVLGRVLYSVLDIARLYKNDCPVQKSFSSGRIEHIDCIDESAQKHYSVKSSPIIDENGIISKCVFLMEDITERIEAKAKEKLLQRELNLTSRLASIGEVAAGITHEINNPLTSVMAFGQILAQKKLPEDIKEAIDVINDSAARIAGIVEKLLAFARRHKPEKEYIDINSVISSVVGMRAYEMRNNNIDLTTDLSTVLPRTMANVGELQQVLLNLIINAEQAISGAGIRKGKITVESKRQGAVIRVIISDNGPGIAEDIQDKLFDPFFTTKVESGGTGLGLSISYGIIQEHGGKIYVRNRASGSGAVFVIELPILAEETQLSDSEPEVPAIRTAYRSRILVVDDELHICNALKTILTGEGHTVETIRSADKAIEKVKTVDYDLILFDIKMPGMDGIEFYEAVNGMKPDMASRVICITGDIISTRNKEFIEETGVPIVTKPFGIEELNRLVNEVLGGTIENAKATYSRR